MLTPRFFFRDFFSGMQKSILCGWGNMVGVGCVIYGHVCDTLRLCVIRLFYAYSASSTHYCEEIPYRFSLFRNLHAFRKLRKKSLVSPLQLPRNVRTSISQNTIWEKLHSGNKISTRTTISLLIFFAPIFLRRLCAKPRARDADLFPRWDNCAVLRQGACFLP